MRGRSERDLSQNASPLVVQLDAMTYGGDAIGRVDGKVVFVQGGIAGERVRAEIVDERERFTRARVIDVVKASPHRVPPRCPHFGFDAAACGGCQWQHIDYAAQLQFKAGIVREQLKRIGRIDAPPALVRAMLPSPDVWAYRNHAAFSVTPHGQAGFQAAHSNAVVPIRECHIVQPPIAAWLARGAAIGKDVRQLHVRSSRSETVEVWGVPDLPPATATFQIGEATFTVSADSFFQVNTSLIETLVDLVIGGLDLRGGETVVDAYCGVGLFSRFIAPRAGRVIGIESSPGAVADARENLAAFDNVELHEGRVETIVPGIRAGVDAVVVDPPRAGCGPKVIEAIVRQRVKRLVYVSCDPATLARDARQLIEGGYTLLRVQPIDMFPQTYHIESIACFEAAGV